MAASDHLQPQQFYHGSPSDLSSGEVLTPERARNSHVYYTDSIDVASRYGTSVYTVAPLVASGDRRRSYGATASEYLTKTGVQVTGRVPDTEIQAAQQSSRTRDS